MPGLRRLAPLVVVAAAACGDGGPPVWAPTPFLTGPPASACLHARELVARAPKLLDEGRVDRAARALQRAEDICPVEAPATWGLRVTALAALGRSAEAMQLVERIERSDRAGDADRAAAVAARAVAEPLGRAVAEGGARREDPELFDPSEKKRGAAADLLRDGVRAARAGDAASAKRLFLDAWAAWHPNPRALVEAGLAARALGDRAEAQRLWDRAAYDDTTAAIRPELPSGAPRALGGAAVAWAAGGGRLAIGGDVEILVLDAELHPVLHLATGDAVTALAFAAGEELLVAAVGGGVRVYDALLGGSVRELRGRARALAASPDGGVIAIAGDDGAVRIWDARTGSAPRVLRAARPAIALAWSADGGRLAWADDAERVAVADVRSGEITALPRARHGAVRGLAFDGDALVVVGAAERVRFDLEHPKKAPRVLARARADGASFGGGALAFDAGAELSITDLAGADAAPLPSLGSGEHGGVLAFALAPSGRALAAVYRDRSVASLPARGGAGRRELARPARLAAFAAAPTGKVLATATEDGRLLVWDTEPVRLRAFAAGGARALAFAPDGHTLAIGRGGRVEVRDVAADRPGVELDAGGHVDGLAFSPDGMRLAAITDEPRALVFDAATRSLAHELRLEAGPVRAVRFSADGRALLLAPKEGVTLWAPDTGRITRFAAYGAEPRDAALAPESGAIAVVDKRGELLLGKLAEAPPTQTIALTSQALALIVAKNGTLVVAEGDRSLTVRTPTGKVIQRFREPDAALRAVAVMPQGAVVAACDDGGIRVFYAPAVAPVAVLREAPGLPAGAVAGVAVGAGGFLDVVGPDADASREALRCRLGAAEYPFDVCADHYAVAGLLAMVLGGRDPAEAEP